MRPNWKEYFMGLAFIIASRSRDEETQHGAIIVDSDNIIIATGYNSLVAHLKDEEWPKTRPDKYPFMIHAEENALLNTNAKLRGSNSTLFVTGKPCLSCIQRVIQSGIKKVVYANRQGTKLETVETNDFFNKLVAESGIEVEKMDYDLSWITEFIKRF